MNKKQTMIASIAAVTAVGAVLLIAGFLDDVDAGTTTSRFTSNYDGWLPGMASKIIVDIESPFGFETVTSFQVFNTDNLIHKSGYHTLRLMGTIMGDKPILLHWIAQELGTMPDGLAADGIVTHGGTPVKMTKAKDGAKMDKIPLTGKVTLKIMEGNQDINSGLVLRTLTFSGCHIAGYHVGTLHDNDKEYIEEENFQYYEQVDFACTNAKDLHGIAMNSREIIVERSYNDDNRQIKNEKGELMITSREYRQPIVMENNAQTKSINVKPEIVTRIQLDKTQYQMGDIATFTVTFADLEGNAIDPDTIRAIYDGMIVQLTKQDTGTYTFATPALAKAHHQMIVSVDKSGFPTDTAYLSIPVHRIS